MSHNIRESLIVSPPIRLHKNKWVPEFTRYWIKRNSELYKKISRLEAQGWIKKIEHQIKMDPLLQIKLNELHHKEINIRKELLHQFPNQKPFTQLKKILLDTNIGIGGIRNWKNKPSIKCLHLWTAYHLGDPKNFENFIGRFVLENI